MNVVDSCHSEELAAGQRGPG